MDITIIKPQATNKTDGIKIGNPQAPHLLLEFLNLRCPYCRQWYQKASPLLTEAVATGQLYRVIKLLDKDKESLQRGNVMHQFVPKDDPEATLAAIEKIFATQDTWGTLSLEEVAEFAQNQLELVPAQDLHTSAAIQKEAASARIQFVPTLILDDHIFDESIEIAELSTYLD